MAGDGSFGFTGDGGPAVNAEINRPEGVAVDGLGNLYIADTYNVIVRAVGIGAVTPTVSVSPANATLYAGQQQTFSATVTNSSNTAVTWSISPQGAGAIDTSGLYTAPAIVLAQQAVTITAISQADTTKSASATLTLAPPVTVSVSPETARLYAGQTVQLTASVINTSNTAVTWSINPSGAGYISSTGLYTAPASITNQQTVTIAATSQAETTKSATVVVTLVPPCISSSPYSYSRAIVIDHTKVTNSDQVDFPFLFNTTDPLFKSTANGGRISSSSGYDIIFSTDPSGLTKLDHELEEYNPLTGQVIAWVRIPNLSHSSDTILYAFYGNSGINASQENPTGVWNSNYKGVWHIADGSAPILLDSTSNGNNAVNDGVTAAEGQVDGAAAFNGTTSYASAGTNITAAQMNTVSVWAYINSLTNDQELVSHSGFGTGVEVLVFSGKICGYVMGSSQSNICSSSGVHVPGWNHIVLTQGGPSAPMNLYINGVSVGTNSAPTSIANPPNLDFGVWANASGRYFSGTLDEVRVSSSVLSADWVAAEYNNQSSPSNFYRVLPENTIVVSPPTASLYASQSLQLTAVAGGSCAQMPTWSMSPAGLGTLTSTGLYTSPSAIGSQQTVTITATPNADGVNPGVTVVTLLTTPFSLTAVLTASTQPPYVTGTTQQFLATLRNQDGIPIAGQSVSFVVTGTNAGNGSGTTDGNGVATFAYAGSQSGSDIVHASANVEGVQALSNAVTAVWLTPQQQISATTITGEFFLSDGSGAFDISPNATPAFTQVFPVINFNPPSGTVPGAPSDIGLTTRPMTDVTTDVNGNFTGTIIAQGNGYQAGVGPMQSFQAVFRGSFTVASAGNVAFNFYTDDGFILGIANGATRVSGANYNMPAVTPFAQFPAMGAINSGNAASGNQVVVHFPSPGSYPFELDYTECCGGGLALTMSQGATNPTGVAPSGSLTISPNSFQPLPVGSQQTLTVLATDASGAPVPNLSVGMEFLGAGGQQVSATTDTTGHATFVYADVDPGTLSAQAVAFISGMITYSNIVYLPWTLPPSTTTANGGGGTLTVSISAPNTVILPDSLQLSGSATDTGLAPGDTISVAWSKVSGPGVVTFANPQQASTTATFSQSGSYVLQLAASDQDASGSAQVAITVNPAPGMSQGWIGSPLDGSAVSGIVPITVAAGTTLQSGTMGYYPGNSYTMTVLNANTTGSGQIGAFDTTTLENGTYWIALQATDTTGKSMYSLALVTVTGNYKPGRVTASVTDLVVPSTGLAINIQRNYDSLKAGTSSDFGYGWSLGTTVDLTVGPRGDVTFTLGGVRRTFYLKPQFGGWVFPLYFAAYTPEPGLHGTLADAGGSGCPNLFDFLVPDSSLWDCAGGGIYAPTAYVYTDPSGTSYTISANGNLQAIADKNGNALTIAPSGITSSTGLSVPFVRDSSGRITKITDPQGNEYDYTYDTSGNLASVKCPNITTESTYNYDSNHLYLNGKDFRRDALPTTGYYQSTIDSNGQCQGDCDVNGLPLNGRLKNVTDALSETTSYTYNLLTNTTTITYPPDANNSVGTATLTYDSHGLLLSSTDPLGLTTTNGYDSENNLTSVTDPLSHTNSYTYDANGNRTSATYPQVTQGVNTTSTTIYNQFSEPTRFTDELGNIRNFTYDANYNPQSVTDTIGGVTATLASFLYGTNGTMQAGAVGYDIATQPTRKSTFGYDVNGNRTCVTDALGRITEYTYNNLGQKTTMVQPAPACDTPYPATTITYTYDAFGHLTQTSAPLGRTTYSAYDANGNKVSDTDANGNVTAYTYDALNRVVTTTYPTSPATTVTNTYDFRGNIVTQTDQAGHVTKNQYGLAGRLTSVTRAFGTASAATTIYTYYDDGRKHTETDPLGHTSTYTYDVAGNLTGVSGVNGNFTYGYDNARNRISMTDGNGHTTQYEYDARKRLTQTTYPDHTTVTNIYDGPGNLSSVTDQAGNVVNYAYDVANQLQTVVQTNSPNAPQNTNTYGYDLLGDLSSSSDANSHITITGYDLFKELRSKTLPDTSSIESRTYDAAGNLASVTHFNGKTTSYTYDTLNRLLSRTPDPTLGEATVSFTYTGTGKRATMTDASGTTTYGYDTADRLTSKATPAGTLNYTYDAAGHVASIASSNTNGASMSYTYDSLNRLGTQNTTTYTYDPASNVATVTYPNGLVSTFTYDSQNRLTAMSTPPVSSYSYTLGATGNRIGAAEGNGRTLNWTYDGIYRLTNETITSDPDGGNGSASYGLDPVSNRTSASSSISGLMPISGTFNADDQLSTETYDPNGNTAYTSGKSFAYDSENRLATMNGGAVQLLYDGDGNRVGKLTGGVTTRYLVDDLNPTGYAQVIEEVANGAVKREYTYGLQRISEYQIVSGTWTASFYGYDGGGSVRQLTNTVGAVTDTYDYDAFGNKINSTGTTPNNYLYRGEQYDPDLGLYYLRARYLNPVTGRFMSRDPEDGKVKEPATLHKYLYAGGDPVNRIDPRGRETVEYVDLSVKQAWEVETGASEFALRLFACFATISDVVYNSVTDWTVWAAGQDAIGAYFCLK